MKIILDKLTTKVHRYKDDNIVIKNNFLYSVINGLPFLHTKEKNLNYTLKFINNIKTGLNKYDGRTRLAHYLYNLSSLLSNFSSAWWAFCSAFSSFFSKCFSLCSSFFSNFSSA